MSKKVYVFGKNGQIGSEIMAIKKDGLEMVGFGRDDINFAKMALVDIYEWMKKNIEPGSKVINTTAFHNLPDCEKSPATAYGINTYVPSVMTGSCHELKCHFTHISTDYVFGAVPPQDLVSYEEDELQSPLNIYGFSKGMGEALVVPAGGCVVRVSGVFGKAGCSAKGGKNFIDTCVKLLKEGKKIEMVADQFLTPSYAKEVAEKILTIDDYGQTIHLVNKADNDKGISWYDMLLHVKELTHSTTPVEPRKSDDDVIKRPKVSALKPTKGYEMSHWKDAIKEYLKEKKYL